MMDHPHAKLIRNAWNAAARGDRDGLAAALAPDFCWHDMGEGPRAGSYHGLEAAIDYLASVGEDAETISSRLIDVLVGEGSAAAQFHIDGERNGKLLDMDYILLCRISEDRLQEAWSVPFDQSVVAAFWS